MHVEVWGVELGGVGLIVAYLLIVDRNRNRHY